MVDFSRRVSEDRLENCTLLKCVPNNGFRKSQPNFTHYYQIRGQCQFISQQMHLMKPNS
jgi:hypothetical protein